MSLARWVVSIAAGLTASLLSFAIIYVRGDFFGVLHFLRERGKVKKLVEAQAPAEQLAVAQEQVVTLAERLGAPDLAAAMLPLELALGIFCAWLVWTWFGQKQHSFEHGGIHGTRIDIQERMVLRLAHRMGGHFTIHDLISRSPLNHSQARDTVSRMLTTGQLLRDGEGFRLP